MQKKQGKENSSQKILMTAFECLAARGYANVSLRDIAGAAGVALSQITYHYKNKENLFIEVIDMMTRQYLSEIEAKLAASNNSKGKIALLIKYFKELIVEKPNMLKLFIDFSAQALWVPSFQEQVDSLFRSITGLIEKHILPETKSNELMKNGYSPKSAAKLILGALYGTSIQIMLGSDKGQTLESLNLAEGILY